MEAVSPHRILQRAAALRRLKSDERQFLESLISDDCGYKIVSRQALADPSLLPGILSSMGARLHRSVRASEMQKISKFLLGLLEFDYERVCEAVLALAGKFVDLWVTITRDAASVSTENSFKFLSESLSRECRLRLFSASYTELELLQHRAALLAIAIHSTEKEFPSLREMAWGALENFIRCQRINSNNVQNCLTTVSTLLSEVRAITKGFNLGLGLAVLEFIWKCKRAEPSMDTVLLIRALGYISEAHPVYYIALSHPQFSELEILELFSTFNSAPVSMYSHCAFLLVLADYPHLQEEDAEILRRHAIATPTLPSAPPPVPYAVKTVQEPYILLACGIVYGEGEMDVSESFVDPDLAHFQYFVCFQRLLGRGGEMDEFASLVRITKSHPSLAQRTLLMVIRMLQQCKDRHSIAYLISNLLQVAQIDDFCATRVIELVRSLVQSSYHLRLLLLPVISQSLAQLPPIFAILSENLSPLLFGGEATMMGAFAYATCLHHIAKVPNRQSYLKFVFASITACLQPSRANSLRHLDAKTVALLFLILKRLIELRFVSPALVWNEFIKDQVELYNDEDFIGACCETIATVCECVPEHEEDYPTAPPICSEACRVLQATFYAKNPTAALCGLSQFPAAFLVFLEIDVVGLFKNACKSSFGEHERFLEKFLKKWIDIEIASMPRSLYLGTAAAARTKIESPRSPSSSSEGANYGQVLSLKVSLWKINPLFAAIKLSEHTDNPEDFCKVYAQICTTPSLSLQHWLLRLEFVQIITNNLDQLFSNLHDAEGLGSFLSLCSGALEGLIKEGQTVSVVSMAVLLQGLLYSVASLHDFNEQRTCQQVERLLKNGGSINPRFASNEDVQASVILAAKQLIQSLSDDGKRRDMDVLLQLYLQGECKVKPQTWLHFLREGVTSNAWPTLLLCPGVEQPPVASGGGDVDGLMLDLLSGNFKDFKEAESRVAQLVNREPPAFSGMLQYGIGVAAAQIDVMEGGRLWESLKASLKSPGPAVKKILVCCTLLGLIKRAGMALEDLTRVLSESLESSTDQRINVWLAVVLDAALKLKSQRSPKADVAGKKRKDHRFGSDSVFGACLDLVYERHQCSPLILESLSQVKVLPRLDWSLVPSEGAGRAALTKLAWSHYRSKTFDGSVYVNESLLELLVKDIEREPQCLLGQLDKVADFLDCLASKSDGLRRFLRAYSDKCIVDGRLLSLILESRALSECRPDEVALLLRPLMANKRDLLVMESWAGSKLSAAFPSDAVVDFFRTKSLRDAIIACQLEPEGLSTVAAVLADHRILSELAVNIMFCIEDSPSSCSLLFSLLREVVRLQTHPFIRSIVWEESDRLAWLQLLNSTNAERREDAVALQSKLRRVEALFPSLGLEEEQYWTA